MKLRRVAVSEKNESQKNRKITIGGGLVFGLRSLSNSSYSLGTGLLLALKSDAWYNLVRNIDPGFNLMYALSSSDSVTQDGVKKVSEAIMKNCFRHYPFTSVLLGLSA